MPKFITAGDCVKLIDKAIANLVTEEECEELIKDELTKYLTIDECKKLILSVIDDKIKKHLILDKGKILEELKFTINNEIDQIRDLYGDDNEATDDGIQDAIIGLKSKRVNIDTIGGPEEYVGAYQCTVKLYKSLHRKYKDKISKEEILNLLGDAV